MHVLFISSAQFAPLPYGDGSTRYRCFNVGEALELSGHQFSVTNIETLSDEHLCYADVISFLRPRYTAKLSKFVDKAKNMGIHTVVDFDDMIFSPEKSAESPLVVNGFSNVERVKKTFLLHEKAAALFDEITVSTSALLELAQKTFPTQDIHLLRNGLSELWLNHADIQLKKSQAHSQCNVPQQRLTYLPGTVGHDEDFRQTQDVILQWLSKDCNRRFCIVGNMALDPHWSTHTQLERWPLVDYFSLPEWIRNSTITIAPLVPNEFNSAKSHIKYLESAAFGVPTICSPNADLNNHSNAKGLYLASTPAQWTKALSQVANDLEDSNLKHKITMEVRDRCHVSTYSEATIQRWYSLTAQRKNKARTKNKESGL